MAQSGMDPHALLTLALLPILLPALAPAPSVRACTSILIGRGATADGSAYIARTVDFGWSNITGNLRYHPARDTPATFASNDNNLTLQLPAPGLAYLAAPCTRPHKRAAVPAGSRNASFEEVGVNSAGLAVSATETIWSSAAAVAADPLEAAGGVLEDAIPSLLLPQAASARQAVQLLGSLIEEHGSGEGFGVLLADAEEVWYLENAAGHHWLAQRVPEGTFFVSGNQGRLQEVNLSDTAAVLASPGLVEHAVEEGLYDPASGQAFNFFKDYTESSAIDVHFNFPRVRRLQQLLGGYQQPPTGGLLPAFLPPGRPLELQDVMGGLRDHYTGGRHDPYAAPDPDEPWRPIAILATGMAHVTRVLPASAGLPPHLSVVTYLSMGAPAWNPFIPLYAGLPPEALPREMEGVDGARPDPSSLFWKGRRLAALMFQDLPALVPRVEAAVGGFNAGVEAEDRPRMQARYAAALAEGDELAAAAELARFTRRVARHAARLLEGLAEEAAEWLGLDGVPPDGQLVRWLDEATEAYLFDPAAPFVN